MEGALYGIYALIFVSILGDPGADSGGKGKSKQAEKYIWNEEKYRTARRAPGDNVLPDQFQTVTAVLASDWCQKTCVFLAPIRPYYFGCNCFLSLTVKYCSACIS